MPERLAIPNPDQYQPGPIPPGERLSHTTVFATGLSYPPHLSPGGTIIATADDVKRWIMAGYEPAPVTQWVIQGTGAMGDTRND